MCLQYCGDKKFSITTHSAVRIASGLRTFRAHVSGTSRRKYFLRLELKGCSTMSTAALGKKYSFMQFFQRKFTLCFGIAAGILHMSRSDFFGSFNLQKVSLHRKCCLHTLILDCIFGMAPSLLQHSSSVSVHSAALRNGN